MSCHFGETETRVPRRGECKLEQLFAHFVRNQAKPFWAMLFTASASSTGPVRQRGNSRGLTVRLSHDCFTLRGSQ